MTKDELHAAAMALPGAALDLKWGDDHCYCVGGKMFAATDGAYTNLGFKATDIAFEALTESGRAKPSKYLARAKWVNIEDLANQDAAEASREAYAQALFAQGLGPITTEIAEAGPFYFAEDYHQQYLAKNPDGYCGIGGTGVTCPIGVGVGA